MATPSSYLLVVDRPSQDDLLFWPALARALAHRRSVTPLVILHAPGEACERVLEGEGLPVRDADGRLDTGTDAARALVRRTLISENRKAAAVLTEEGVSAVPFPGTTRSLFDRGDAPWLSTMLAQGVLPVISAVAGTDEQPVEADLSDAAVHLARILRASVILLGRHRSSGPESEKTPSAAKKLVFGPEVLESCIRQGISVRVTDVSGMHESDPGEAVRDSDNG